MLLVFQPPSSMPLEMVDNFSEAENIARNTVMFCRCPGQHLHGVCVLLTPKNSKHIFAIERASCKHSECVYFIFEDNALNSHPLGMQILQLWH